MLAVGNDRQFTALCTTLGRAEFATDERFGSNSARVAHREALRMELEQLLAARPAAAWVEALSHAGVPAGQVNDIAGAFALAERLGLEPIVEIPGDGRAARLIRNPIRLSVTPAQYTLPPPALPARVAVTR